MSEDIDYKWEDEEDINEANDVLHSFADKFAHVLQEDEYSDWDEIPDSDKLNLVEEDSTFSIRKGFNEIVIESKRDLVDLINIMISIKDKGYFN